jgi:hypothetical protein
MQHFRQWCATAQYADDHDALSGIEETSCLPGHIVQHCI